MVRQVVNVSPSLRGKVAEVGTQVQVDENDPAFKNPSKPIGDFMTKAKADEMGDKYGWVIMERNDSPDKEKPYRRIVASPEPVDIAEISAIKVLVNNGIVTVCCGGGGVPFILKKDGTIEWVDAVIDKDSVAALAAVLLQTSMLAIFTASEGIYTPGDFQRKRDGDLSAKPVPRLTVKELEQSLKDLPAGSMGPKAEALRRFSAATGNVSWVGPLDRGFEALTNGGGTTIVPA
jgi:carbamate kinase